MNKNDLFEAINDIDPVLTARSESGSSFAKSVGKHKAANSGRMRNILPLIIIPVAAVAALTAVIVMSRKNSVRNDPSAIVSSETPDPTEAGVTEAGATDAAPKTEPPATYDPGDPAQWPVPVSGSDLLYMLDSYMRHAGFEYANHPDGLKALSEYRLNGKKISESAERTSTSADYEDGFEQIAEYALDDVFMSSSRSEKTFLQTITGTKKLFLLTYAKLEGLDLPLKVEFGDSALAVLTKTGIAGFAAQMCEEFAAHDSETENFYGMITSVNPDPAPVIEPGSEGTADEDSYVLEFSRSYGPVNADTVFPYEYVLSFTTVQRKDGVNTERYMALTFSGYSLEQSSLSTVVMIVTETTVRTIEENATPAPTPTAVPTEPPEVTATPIPTSVPDSSPEPTREMLTPERPLDYPAVPGYYDYVDYPDLYFLDSKQARFFTTYKEVYVYVGESFEVPVTQGIKTWVPEETNTITYTAANDSVISIERIEERRPNHSIYNFYVTGLRPGTTTVRVYGWYDPSDFEDQVNILVKEPCESINCEVIVHVLEP